jgi:hypothetical protein
MDGEFARFPGSNRPPACIFKPSIRDVPRAGKSINSATRDCDKIIGNNCKN